MRKYINTVLTSEGGPLVGASVLVSPTGTTTPASLFSNQAGTIALANPLTTDNDGSFSFYAADGRYDLAISRTGYATRTITDVALEDPSDASPAVFSRVDINVGADNSGSDSLNLYYQGDAYLPNASITGPDGSSSTPGWTVSSSRGSGLVPSRLLANDFIGKFAAWGYSGVSPAYNEHGYLGWYATGATANNLGGEARLMVKADGGALAEALRVDNTRLATLANGLKLTAGDVTIGAAGAGLKVKEGSNARMGVATLAGGAALVANTSVTASSRIVLTSQVDGGTPGFLRVSARVPGTSFTIASSSGSDTSTVAYLIVEPAP